LLTYALESGNLVLLESILKMVPDLMEEHLVECLKLILLSIRKHSMDSFITMWAGAKPNPKPQTLNPKHSMDSFITKWAGAKLNTNPKP